jgi:DNA-binding CsgD family transcriptional regulator
MKSALLDIATPPATATQLRLKASPLAGPGVLLLTFSRTPIYVTAQARQLLSEINGEGYEHPHDDLVLPLDVLELCATLDAKLLQPRQDHAPNQLTVERRIPCHASTILLRAFSLPPQHTLHNSQTLILLERIDSPAAPIARRESSNYLLTVRQLSIVDGITRGLTNKQLADELGISIHTVKEYLRQVMMKLNASSRTAIVSRMAGMLPSPPTATEASHPRKRPQSSLAPQIA